jgi:hypothetical protein
MSPARKTALALARDRAELGSKVKMKRMADDGELVRPDPESVVYGLPNTPKQLLDLLKEAQPT